MPRFDGSDFLDPRDKAALASESAEAPRPRLSAPPICQPVDGGTNVPRGLRCGSCGCGEEQHEDVGPRFGRFLGNGRGIPAEALHWSQLEVALWGDTGGLFRPRRAEAREPDRFDEDIPVEVRAPDGRSWTVPMRKGSTVMALKRIMAHGDASGNTDVATFWLREPGGEKPSLPDGERIYGACALEVTAEPPPRRPPRPVPPQAAQRAEKAALVSVICPTTASRRHFHPLLWLCFECQCYKPRELVIIDTCEDEPADFFVKKMSQDPRVVYRHFRVPDDRWSVGLKRNLACYFASGEIIAHFDDDDLYASCYLEDMVRFMRSPHDAFPLHSQMGCGEESLWQVAAELDRGDQGSGQPEEAEPLWHLLSTYGAACAKLSSWHTLALRTGAWSSFDALQCGEDGGSRRSQLLGWGFSMVYLRAAWERVPFLHIGLGEDFDFVACLRRLCLPVILVPDTRGICAHTHHVDNTSGSCSERRGKKLRHVPTRLATFAAMYQQVAQQQPGAKPAPKPCQP